MNFVKIGCVVFFRNPANKQTNIAGTTHYPVIQLKLHVCDQLTRQPGSKRVSMNNASRTKKVNGLIISELGI